MVNRFPDLGTVPGSAAVAWTQPTDGTRWPPGPVGSEEEALFEWGRGTERWERPTQAGEGFSSRASLAQVALHGDWSPRDRGPLAPGESPQWSEAGSATKVAVGNVVGGTLASCSPQCVCDTRPWLTPQSLARQAHAVDGNDRLLTRVPPALAPDTQVLLRQSHEIARLPGTLQHLPNLTEPDLSRSRLASLPRLLTLHPRGLAALEELSLDHNRLLSVAPSALAGLARLLRNANRLRAVGPRWFLPLPRLQLHVLGESPILRLEPGGFRPLGRLTARCWPAWGCGTCRPRPSRGLSLFGSRLARVPAAALRRPPLLKFLELKKNPIRELRAGDFRGTPRLEQLSLGALEELTGAAEGAFAGLPQLAKPDLNPHPRLAYLPPAALQGAPALHTLLATDGALGLLPGRLLASLPSLAALSLRGNPLRCDRPAAWLGLARLRRVDPGATLCAAPPGAAGRLLREGLEGGGGRGCPPAFPPRGWPERLGVAPGGSVTLSCPASAELPPEISWLGPARGGPWSWSGVELAHAGQYTSVAQNEAGSGSRALALEVLGGGGRGGAARSPEGGLGAGVVQPCV
ncbi:unnamed protein product [Caretta caretta]